MERMMAHSMLTRRGASCEHATQSHAVDRARLALNLHSLGSVGEPQGHGPAGPERADVFRGAAVGLFRRFP